MVGDKTKMEEIEATLAWTEVDQNVKLFVEPVALCKLMDSIVTGNQIITSKNNTHIIVNENVKSYQTDIQYWFRAKPY